MQIFKVDMKEFGFISNLFNSKTISQIKKIIYFIRLSRVNLWFIPLSIFLTLSHTLIATYGVSLLFPLINGILTENFEHVRNIRGLDYIIKSYPDNFRSFSRLFILLIFWIYLINIVKNVFNYFSITIAASQSRISTARIRNMLVEEFLKFGKSFYDLNKTNQIMRIITSSAGNIQTQIRMLQDLIGKSLLLTAYLFVMLKISWKLMLVSVVIFPLILWVNRKLIKRINAYAAEQRKFSSNLGDKIFNILHCMPVIKTFGQEKRELHAFNQLSLEEMEAGGRIDKLKGLASPIDDIGIMTGNICIALMMAALMKYESSLSAANAFIFYFLLTRTVPTFNSISRFNMNIEKTSLELDEMQQILEQQHLYIIPDGTEKITEFNDSIELKNLSFSYPGKTQTILNNINFSVKKNSVVAIVGASGSGKTTIINLILRLYDCDAGQLFIDGKDIRNYEIDSLRRLISVVSQDALLFNDTIRNNILYGSENEVSDDELNSILQKLGLENFINKFPEKLETIVQEKGTRLSGGERQRISIARAAIRKSPILIMDEATSSLDAESESSITEGIYAMSNERTLIIIAHRLSTIRKADKIIFIENGTVQEQGTWQELIEKKGLFYNQYTAQQI